MLSPAPLVSGLAARRGAAVVTGSAGGITACGDAGGDAGGIAVRGTVLAVRGTVPAVGATRLDGVTEGAEAADEAGGTDGSPVPSPPG